MIASASPVSIYMLKVNNRNTRTSRETCSKLKFVTKSRHLTKLLKKSIDLLEAAIRGVLIKKDVLKNFAKFTGKHLCRSCVFIVNFEHISYLVLLFL